MYNVFNRFSVFRSPIFATFAQAKAYNNYTTMATDNTKNSPPGGDNFQAPLTDSAPGGPSGSLSTDSRTSFPGMFTKGKGKLTTPSEDGDSVTGTQDAKDNFITDAAGYGRLQVTLNQPMPIPRTAGAPYFEGPEATSFLRTVDRMFSTHNIAGTKERKQWILDYSHPSVAWNIEHITNYLQMSYLTLCDAIKREY
jgi:hypothetical protein